MRNIRSWMMLALLLISMTTFALSIRPIKAAPATIIVPDNYATIQEAINNANPGDTIQVRAGTYYENVVANKTVSLLGVEGTIIDASQEPVGMVNPSIAKWNGITVLANYCSVTGFEIVNAVNFGIEIRADYGVFEENHVENCSWAGISCYAGIHDGVTYHSSHDNLVCNNTIRRNHMGIWLSEAYSNVISCNIIESNRWNGIYLSSESHDNAIANNLVSKSCRTPFNEGGYGIAIGSGSHNNVIVGNNISDNVADGIRIEIFGSGVPLPHDNLICHNSFLNNAIQAHDTGFNDLWDNGYPSGGNYWSDYNSVDSYNGPHQDVTGSDGVGDTPYVIDGVNQDNYPFMSQNGWETYPISIESNVTITNMAANEYSLNFTVSGPTGEIGYVNATVPVGLNATDITVFVDDVQPSPPFPTITSNGTHYFVYFEFTLSTHDISIRYRRTIPGDVNADGVVDSTDLGILGGAWGSFKGDLNYVPEADINDDGVVDSSDLGIMGVHWGEME